MPLKNKKLGKSVYTDEEIDEMFSPIDVDLEELESRVGTLEEGGTGGELVVDPMKFTPHKWTVGTEYDFGDGSFGKRYTGNFSVAMNTPLSTVLDSAFTGIKISKSGGDWDLGNGGRQSVKGTAITGTPGNISISFSSTIFINGVNLYINTFVAATTRTNAPYDVWVIYTKA